MKATYLILILNIYVLPTVGQNCANTSVGYPPIQDLGGGFWQGAQGGLYPNGSNYRPAYHQQQGMNIALNLLPLDAAGSPDPLNGSIVWLSIGMSNTTQETQLFLPMTDTFQDLHPKLKLVDGAQGGQDINAINNPGANYWQVIYNRLAAAGLTANQVQVIWFKEAEAQPGDTVFASYTQSLKTKYKNVMRIIRQKFPNAVLCYLSSRIYAGYASTTLNPEPFAYYTGWTVKQLIEDQVNGDTSLIYAGANARAPWLSWGPYLWADGLLPRNDGLTWVCPTDFNADGTHPSPAGRQKVAQMLFDFFKSDSTACPWFLKNCSLLTSIQDHPEKIEVVISINPPGTILNIQFSKEVSKAQLFINSISGEQVFSSADLNGSIHHLQIPQLPPGMYVVQVLADGRSVTKKLLKN